MFNNPGSTDLMSAPNGFGGQNGPVTPAQRGQQQEAEEEEEEPRLPQIWISKSASMELDLI